MSSQGYYKKLKELKYAEESALVKDMIQSNDWINAETIKSKSHKIVENCRRDRNKTRLDSFFLEYGLSNQEGIALMCLAESLLRIPDNQTCDDIIEEKQKKLAEERGYEIIDHSMVLYVKPIKD